MGEKGGVAGETGRKGGIGGRLWCWPGPPQDCSLTGHDDGGLLIELDAVHFLREKQGVSALQGPPGIRPEPPHPWCVSPPRPVSSPLRVPGTCGSLARWPRPTVPRSCRPRRSRAGCCRRSWGGGSQGAPSARLGGSPRGGGGPCSPPRPLTRRRPAPRSRAPGRCAAPCPCAGSRASGSCRCRRSGSSSHPLGRGGAEVTPPSTPNRHPPLPRTVVPNSAPGRGARVPVPPPRMGTGSAPHHHHLIPHEGIKELGGPRMGHVSPFPLPWGWDVGPCSPPRDWIKQLGIPGMGSRS